MYSIIQYFVTFAVLIPILIGIVSKVSSRKELFPVFILLIVSFTIEVVNSILIEYNVFTFWILNLFAIVEFTLIWAFYNDFISDVKSTTANYVVLFLFLAVALFDLLFLSGFKQMNNITIAVESITLIIYSLICFYLIMSRMLFDKLLDTPFFWINIAVLFYFSGSLFLFLFGNYLVKQGDKVYLEMYKIHTFVNAVWYLFISIGFWKVKKA